jgi:hypothetical protein
MTNRIEALFYRFVGISFGSRIRATRFAIGVSSLAYATVQFGFGIRKLYDAGFWRRDPGRALGDARANDSNEQRTGRKEDGLEWGNSNGPRRRHG